MVPRKSPFRVLDRAVLPGIPMAQHDFHELFGAVITQIVGENFALAEIGRLGIVERGDDIPGDPPAEHRSSVANTRAQS